MFLIVLAHSSSPSFYQRFYIPIHLSAFFMAGGYTFNPRKSFADFSKRKLCTQIWPFLTLGLVNAACGVIVEHDAISDRLQYLISRNRIWDDLWFIACLIVAEFIFYGITALAEKITKKNEGKPYLSFVFFVSVLVTVGGLLYVKFIDVPLPWQFEGACISVVFVAIGCCYRKVEDRVADMIRGQRFMYYLGITGVYLLLAGFINNDVSVHGEEYGAFLLYFVMAVLGGTSLVMACKWLEKRSNANKLSSVVVSMLGFVGQNTLVYYAFQSKFIKLSYIMLGKLGIEMSAYIVSILVAILVYLVLLIPAWLIKKWFPWVLRLPERKSS